MTIKITRLNPWAVEAEFCGIKVDGSSLPGVLRSLATRFETVAAQRLLSKIEEINKCESIS